MDMTKSLFKFYEGKAHEPEGGQIFKVYNRAAYLGNWWGRSEGELRIYLVGKEVRFTRIEALI